MNKQIIKDTALKNGFKLKEQPNGELDLNPYVYDFADELVKDQKQQIESLKAQLAQYQSDDYVSVKKSVIKQLIIELDHIFSAHELLGLTDLIALRDGFSLLVDDEAQEQSNG